MSTMLLVPLEDLVVFPNMNVTLTVDVGAEERVLLVPRHENDYAGVGVVAEVTDRVRLPGGARAVALNGLHRGVAGKATTDAQGSLRVEVEERPDPEESDARMRELETEYRAVVEEILDLRGDDGRISAFVRSITEPGALADTAGYSPDLSFAQKVELLETLDVRERLELSIRFQRERLAEMQVRRRIREDVEEGAAKQQREYILRRQMESIRKELGEDDASVVDEYRRKLEEAELPEAVREQAERELSRLERQGDSSPEASMIRNYLDWILAVPWGKRSEERLDPAHTREVLDADHAGLDDVKDRIVEYIAVRKLREERGIEPDKKSGAILTLVGPPGNRQDLDRRVDRSCARTRVRPHVARRRPRRGRDPRSPAHLHRRAAGPARPCPARRRDDEPGDPARRGRQGRRRLAGRPVLGAARGARPGAEPLVPRPLPRSRARPLRGRLHRDRERGRLDPGAAARPDGGDPVRRLHDRREGRDRPRLSLAAPAGAERPARGRGVGVRRRPRDGDLRLHPRGRRAAARARAREAAAQDRDRDRIRAGRGAGGARRSSRSAMPSGGRSSSARRPSGRRFPALRPGWP